MRLSVIWRSRRGLPMASIRLAALDGLCWEKSEEYIDAEKIYQLTYEIEV